MESGVESGVDTDVERASMKRIDVGLDDRTGHMVNGSHVKSTSFFETKLSMVTMFQRYDVCISCCIMCYHRY